ncbi:MAG: DUF5703 domain-containing protein [Puniceicoccales bacterium]|jgi:hypothetical protein|nr:DUF5703 domain-containing protein [Puniceicoccales bacterium]
MKKSQFFSTMLLLFATGFYATLPMANARETEQSVSHLVWETPGETYNDTMPLGNGEVALNAWVDKFGDLRFYIARTDSIDENGQLLKIGAVRVRIGEGDHQRTAAFFTQKLDTTRGVMETEFGTGADKVSIRLWVDAHRPVIVVEAKTEKPTSATAYNEAWRTKRETRIEKRLECSDLYRDCPYENRKFREAFRTKEYDYLQTIIEPDTLLDTPNEITWFHHNTHSKPYQLTALIQGTDDFRRQDPILHRTFGAIIRCTGPEKIDKKTLRSATKKTHRFEIVALTKHPATKETWLAQARQILDAAQKIPISERTEKHEAWWRDFTTRSWVHITQGSDANEVNFTRNNVFSTNKHRVRIGKDQGGDSVFNGTFGRVAIYPVVLNDNEVGKLSKIEHQSLAGSGKSYYDAIPTAPSEIPNSSTWKFAEGVTFEAWIRPKKLLGYVRIIDKITPGGSDGFLFDIIPNGALRCIVRDKVKVTSSVLKVNQWQHVAVTISATGNIRFFIDGKPIEEKAKSADVSDTFVLSRAYALQRYLSACNGRGNLPIKFNGSLFTVPAKGTQGDADYRRWGPGYWWQNTRLPYLSMNAAGDFAQMQPFFKTYFDLLQFCKHRTKKYYGHGGAFYPECIFFWGDVFLETYGWEMWNTRKEKIQKSGYHKYEWVGGLEIAFMLIEHYEYIDCEKFLKEKVIPFTREILTFFDEHYQTDQKGKMVMYPSQALETWWDCTNPMPELAGLYGVIAKLEGLSGGIPGELKTLALRLKRKLPPIPVTPSPEGKPMLAPAARFAKLRNSENPELYAVFPFRLFAYDKPNIEWATDALKYRRDRGSMGWRQDDLFMAYLGLAKQAGANLVERAKNKHKASRFPAFWGPNYDWVPDQDHGGVLTKGVQVLLMQCDGKKIDLFPAWPNGWNCDFKLHAPHKTTVEGTLKDGVITRLIITPAARAKDVRILLKK